MPTLAIRPLVETDLDALLGLYAQLHPTDVALPARSQVLSVWQAILSDPKLHCLGGFVGDELAVSCLLSITPNLTRGCRSFGLIENVITHADHRRRGYGRAILLHASDIAWQHGCYKVMLQTGRKDEVTLAFYESAGFDRQTKQALWAAAPVRV